MPSFYRCGTCRARSRSDRRKCHCGVKDWRVDGHRMKEWRERGGVYQTCHCIGLYYPHRIASSVWCDKHPTGASEEDHEARYGNT